MSDPHRPGEHIGSGDDRSARERDVLRELHELTDRPRAGEPPVRLGEEPGSRSDPDEPRRRPQEEEGR